MIEIPAHSGGRRAHGGGVESRHALGEHGIDRGVERVPRPPYGQQRFGRVPAGEPADRAPCLSIPRRSACRLALRRAWMSASVRASVEISGQTVEQTGQFLWKTRILGELTRVAVHRHVFADEGHEGGGEVAQAH